MKKIILPILLLLIVIQSCNQETIQPILSISETYIKTNSYGTTKNIYIKSNVEWNIIDNKVPEWCSIIRERTTEKDYLKIEILQNHTFKNREYELKIYYGNRINTINIIQDGISNDNTINIIPFFSNTIEKVYNSENKISIFYNNIFISNKNYNNVYHGNIINNKLNSDLTINQVQDTKFDKINISSLVGSKFYYNDNINPSLISTKSLFNIIKSDILNQNQNYSFDNDPIQYNSYKHLHFLGISNIGLSLDELITGNSYKINELVNRTGLIYCYSNVLFSIKMDNPNISRSELTNNNEISYVSDIQYGKIAILIVETSFDKEISNSVIKKIMKNIKLSTYEENVKKTIQTFYLTFNENKEITIHKGSDYIQDFISKMKEQPIIPLFYSINNYNSISKESMNVIFNL